MKHCNKHPKYRILKGDSTNGYKQFCPACLVEQLEKTWGEKKD